MKTDNIALSTQIHKWSANSGYFESNTLKPCNFQAPNKPSIGKRICVAAGAICFYYAMHYFPYDLSSHQTSFSTEVAIFRSENNKTAPHIPQFTPIGKDPDPGKAKNTSDISYSARAKLKGQLKDYSTYQDNWDDEGAREPYKNAILDALAFIDCLPSEILIPEPMLEHDGSISFLWSSDNADAVARFRGNEKFAWFVDNFKNAIELNDSDEIVNIDSSSKLILALKKAGFWNELPAA